LDLVHVIVLALLQGVTEFLPISSSGHLILIPALFGWPDQGLAFDIAVHAGTLLAVIVYFRRELLGMAATALRFGQPESRLGWQVVVATVPLGLAGLAFADAVETSLRAPVVIAASTAFFGLLLWLADRFGRGARDEYQLAWLGVLLIGLAQALALIPGTSRSGITMTAALAIGMSREAAGRFSFLLAIPAIGMAALWQSLQFAADPAPVPWLPLGLAAAVSALTAFATIALFLNLIGRMGMTVFALYRFALAAVIVYVLV